MQSVIHNTQGSIRQMNQLNERQEKIKKAFAVASTNCGGQSQMLAALNCSATWMYACIKRGTVPLIIAKKLEVLTKGEFTWQETSPHFDKRIRDVSKYLEQ